MIGVGIGITSLSVIGRNLASSITRILQLSTAGLSLGGDLNNSRTSTATVIDHEGVYRTAKVGETRLQGARRVENLLAYTDDFSNAVWIRQGGGTGSVPTKTPNYATAPDGSTTACLLVMNKGAGTNGNDKSLLTQAFTPVSNQRSSIWAKSATSASYEIKIGTTNVDQFITVTPTWQRFTHPVDTGVSEDFFVGLKDGTVNTAQILIWHPMAEDTTGCSNTAPSAYVSSSIEYNATVNGVEYHLTTNGNSVASNIVTSAPGSSISGAYYLLEPAATNYFLDSSNPATQTINLTAGTYTIWLEGSGSMTLSGGATGVANNSGPLTFTTTGSTTFTKSGTVTKVQVEAGSKATSYLPTVRNYTTTFDVSTPSTNVYLLPAADTRISVEGSGSATVYHGANGMLGLLLLSALGSEIGTASVGSSLSYTSPAEYVTVVISGSVTRLLIESKLMGSPVSRSADRLSVVAQTDYNWYQASGLLMMRFVTDYSASETNNTPLFSGGDLKVSNANGYTATDGTTILDSAASELVSGTEVVVALIWDTDESKMAISYRNGAGSFEAWHETTYDGSMTLAANLEWFKTNPYTNKLYATRIYYTPGKTVSQIKAWAEANASNELI